MNPVYAADPAVLDRMPGIALNELVERAALLTRTDRKYVLTTADLPALLAALAARRAQVLRIGDQAGHEYRTVYFDTSTMDFYRATALRRRRRGKVRVRSYLAGEAQSTAPEERVASHFLEVKTRTARGATVKYRFPHPDDGGTGLQDYSLVDECLADSGLPGRADRELAATVATHYRRTTLFLPHTGVRVTVDSALSWALPDGRRTTVPDTMIVETKSPTAAATELDRLLWSGQHRPYPLSKFGLGLALLRPELPANRWALVLRRHFAEFTERTFGTGSARPGTSRDEFLTEATT